MDDFSILTLTEIDMPPEIEVNLNFEIKPPLSNEIILVLRDMRLRVSNMLRIMEHY